jgi:hypothetical protein
VIQWWFKHVEFTGYLAAMLALAQRKNLFVGIIRAWMMNHG